MSQIFVISFIAILLVKDVQSTCLETSYYSDQIGLFLNWASVNLVPDATWVLPSQTQLFHYACTQIENTGLHYDILLDASLNLWLRYFLGYNEWSTQLGPNAYSVPPMVFSFFNDSTVFYAGPGEPYPPILVTGKANIIFAYENQGYWVNWVNLVAENNMDTFVPNNYQLYYQGQKNATVFATNTTSGLSTYHIIMSTARQESVYPKTVITKIWDIYPQLLEVRLFGLCSVLCVDCVPGTMCSP